MSEPFSYHQAPLGDHLTLTTDRGERSFPIAGIFYDYTSQQGLVLMSRTVYERYWDDRGVDTLAVYVEDGFGSRNGVLVVEGTDDPRR